MWQPPPTRLFFARKVNLPTTPDSQKPRHTNKSNARNSVPQLPQNRQCRARLRLRFRFHLVKLIYRLLLAIPITGSPNNLLSVLLRYLNPPAKLVIDLANLDSLQLGQQSETERTGILDTFGDIRNSLLVGFLVERHTGVVLRGGG